MSALRPLFLFLATPISSSCGVMRIAPTLLAASLAASTLYSQPQAESFKLVASDAQAGDEFGRSVAVSANRVVVGSWHDGDSGSNSGSVYVYDAQTGAETAKLIASDGEAFDTFGFSVDIDGDTLIAGAPFSVFGAAYVFVRSGSSWIEQVKLRPGDAAVFDNFGYSVSIDGGTAIVGSFRDDDIFSGSGSAHVYVRNGGSWAHQAKLMASNPEGGAWFGTSVSICGDTVVIGSPFADGLAGIDLGSAYIFVRNAGAWTQQAELIPDSALSGDFVGYSVSISGETVVLGALLANETGNDSGAAHVFVRNGTTWTEQAKLLPSDPSPEDHFGVSVAIEDDTILVGSHWDNDNGSDSGSVYLFTRSGTTWQEEAKLLASDGTAADDFGFSVALEANTAVVGADLSDGTNFDCGSAYLFNLSSSGSPYCFGDGSGRPCPCGANAGTGQGCTNTGGSGATLAAFGNPSLSNDSFQLHVAGLPGSNPGLILRGMDETAAGLGNLAGDGLLCTTGQIARSQVQLSLSGSMTFSDFQGQPFGASSYGAGILTHYQLWYRDPANTCSGSGFNFSNAWAVTWLL